MYQISQLMSTPVASKYSSQSEKEYAVEPSPPCILPSSVCDFLNGDSPFEGRSGDPLTDSPFTCRRSPRLLTNGYYIWTEDSFLCDKDGNITLSPSQTRVLYKENLVRIFRKKRRIRRSFSSLFNLSASESWLHGSIFDDVDSSPSEDVWLEGVRRLETNHCKENGGDYDCSLTDDWESQKLNAESVKASFSGPVASQRPRENSYSLSPQSQWTASERFQEEALDHPRAGISLQPGDASTEEVTDLEESSQRNQFVTRGLLSSNSACCMLNHFCLCKVVSGRNHSQCLLVFLGDNHCLCSQVILFQPCQLFQSYHLHLSRSENKDY
ncbi:transmembrane protein 71 isoform X2 [Bubalus bubalis]|uniref:transmembrane protein 71 isoform X2 n=1 Tax=Bubalus bubalis TaxID=89462 RepID=UPI000DBC9709|nr:transmembrane protein 71 isoform X2 [Bubalus bubalis]XP_025121312.3 transmembrane protein 71 isoform X2 [Bubalus bubalis]